MIYLAILEPDPDEPEWWFGGRENGYGMKGLGPLRVFDPEHFVIVVAVYRNEAGPLGFDDRDAELEPGRDRPLPVRAYSSLTGQDLSAEVTTRGDADRYVSRPPRGPVYLVHESDACPTRPMDPERLRAAAATRGVLWVCSQGWYGTAAYAIVRNDGSDPLPHARELVKECFACEAFPFTIRTADRLPNH